MDLSAQLRKAVDDSIAAGATRYSIAKGAGIDYATFAKWLDEGRDIRLSTVSALAAHLGLELQPIDAAAAKSKVKAPAMHAVDWGASEPGKKRKSDVPPPPDKPKRK